ncbi:hypothetical protein JHD48_00650 [Sulfurimonas sp. SAG-AH-194-I05]|nr:hypothetical protein [Sulfurimonas sp. SAG-AH-194-I05]MDF1874236.1 hypothetical protein [Sulfurimonas sp. SAG-AH-194-I05]
MGKIDKEKEHIGALKVYLALITAFLMGDISGTIKLFQNDVLDFTFWIGVISIVVLAIAFMKVAKFMHKKINDLEDL